MSQVAESDSEDEQVLAQAQQPMPGMPMMEVGTLLMEATAASIPAEEEEKSDPKGRKKKLDMSMGDAMRLKKRRRTSDNNFQKFHDDDELGADYVRNAFKGRIWNDQMDEALGQAAMEFDKDWTLVNNKLNSMFGTGLTNSQCQKRWAQYVADEVKSKKQGPWSQEEIEMLQTEAPKHMRESRDTKGKMMYNWDAVSKALNRRYYDCQNKFNTISKANLKVGRFTQEEDETIRRTVGEMGHKQKQGMWMHLQGQLGRRNDVIRKRWQTVLCKRTGGVDLSAPSNPSNPSNPSSSSGLGLTFAPPPDFNQFEFLPIPVIPVLPTSASIPLLPLEYVAEIASAAIAVAEVPQSMPINN